MTKNDKYVLCYLETVLSLDEKEVEAEEVAYEEGQ